VAEDPYFTWTRLCSARPVGLHIWHREAVRVNRGPQSGSPQSPSGTLFHLPCAIVQALRLWHQRQQSTCRIDFSTWTHALVVPCWSLLARASFMGMFHTSVSPSIIARTHGSTISHTSRVCTPLAHDFLGGASHRVTEAKPMYKRLTLQGTDRYIVTRVSCQVPAHVLESTEQLVG
jgi:hypothetical protein